MKNKLTRRQMIGSLAIPIVIIAAAVYKYISDSLVIGDFSLRFAWEWSYIGIVVLGGIAPVSAAIWGGVDTSGYLVPRVIISACTLGMLGMVSEFLYETALTASVLLLFASVIFSAVFFFKQYAKTSEWLVMFISNPIFCYLIWLLCYIADVKRLAGLSFGESI